MSIYICNHNYIKMSNPWILENFWISGTWALEWTHIPLWKVFHQNNQNLFVVLLKNLLIDWSVCFFISGLPTLKKEKKNRSWICKYLDMQFLQLQNFCNLRTSLFLFHHYRESPTPCCELLHPSHQRFISSLKFRVSSSNCTNILWACREWIHGPCKTKST